MPTPAHIVQTDHPTVALVGRVNVGKSTLFNRLIEKNQAIVSDIGGTTRTSNVGTVLWRGSEFTLIDTGGLTFQDDIPLEADIIKQTEMAIDRADIVVFVTDGTTSILPQEREIAQLLKKKNIPVVLVANKLDNARRERTIDIGSYMKLGFGEPFYISAASGRNLGDLLDVLYEQFEQHPSEPSTAEEIEDIVNICLIGKPNVGKSSLFNKLIGEERVIVSDMAHTTREPHDTLVLYTPETVTKDPTAPEDVSFDGDNTIDTGAPVRLNFIDTAGIRRKNKVEGFLERAGIGKSLEQIDRSDIVLLVLDATEPISSQDKQLGGLLERRSKSVIILVNKWDLTDDNSEERRKYVIALIRAHFAHLDFAPILFVSGLTGYRVHQVFPTLMQVIKGRSNHVANRALEYFLTDTMKRKLPSRGKGTNHPKLLGMRQINDGPPIFELFVLAKTSLHRSYLNYLENRLREEFDFTGTPIVIKLTKVKR